MINFTNKDSAFFEVESDDVQIKNEDITKNVISISITEEFGNMTRGTIRLYDPDLFYSRVLRNGVKLKIAWGYKKDSFRLDDNRIVLANVDEFSNVIERRGLEGIVQNPSGGGDANGINTFNCNFVATGLKGIFGVNALRRFDNKTRQSIVGELFDELGVSPVKRDIDFDNMSDVISERQDAPTYAFLASLALKWRAFFAITYAQTGEVVGCFIRGSKIGDTQYSNWVNGATGRSNFLDYKGTISNVISYNWKRLEGENGSGDNVVADLVDGEIVFRRYLAEQKSVRTYRLREADLAKFIKKTNDAEGLASTFRLIGEFLSVRDFEKIEHWFDSEDTPTAPQGSGFTLNIKMLGNPTYTAMNRVTFGEGFPSPVGGDDLKWYVRTVTHKIDAAGYFMDLTVNDAYAFNDTGEFLTG